MSWLRGFLDWLIYPDAWIIEKRMRQARASRILSRPQIQTLTPSTMTWWKAVGDRARSN